MAKTNPARLCISADPLLNKFTWGFVPLESPHPFDILTLSMCASFEICGKTYKPGKEIIGSGKSGIIRHVWAGFAGFRPRQFHLKNSP